MSLSAFVQLLMSTENSAVDQGKSELSEADLEYPVTDYWIKTSHNSFLTGHQLYSRSSADMYRRQLLLGVRSLEIDCWDGLRGQPKVTHGMTLCSSISFAAVAAAIAETAFETSNCPVFLSLEMVMQAQSEPISREGSGCIFEVPSKPVAHSGSHATHQLLSTR